MDELEHSLATTTPRKIFLFRCPLLSVEDYASSLQTGTSEYVENLTSFLNSKIQIEALLAGSPSLAISLLELSNEDDDIDTHKAAQLLPSLVRYKIRMSTRPTPFAQFAGVGIGFVDTDRDASILLSDRSCFKPHARLDMEYLLKMVFSIEELAEVRHQLKFYANPMVYKKNSRIYLPFSDGYGQGDKNQAVSVRTSKAVSSTLSYAREPVLWHTLRKNLANDFPSIDDRVFVKFLDTLWEQGILLSTLRPPLTIVGSLEWVIARLEETSYRGLQLEKLHTLKMYLDNFNSLPIGEGRNVLTSLYKETGFSAGDKQNAIEIDTNLDVVHARLSNGVVDELKSAAHVLLRLSTIPIANRALADFAKDFVEKYSEREIPVLELLDDEVGLGPPATYRHPAPDVLKAPLLPIQHARRDKTLLELAGTALHCRQHEVVLNESLLSDLEVEKDLEHTAPPSLDLFAFVNAKDEKALNRGEFLAMVAPRVGAAPAGRSFSRFCHVLPADVTDWLKAEAKAEEERYPDIVFADLVYNHPRGHATNVAVRPNLYSHQITINATPTITDAQNIPLNDIVVGIKNGQFYLASRSLQKPLLVRSMHLLNFASAPNVCRFLQEVSDDQEAKIGPFDWGVASQLPYLPRIRHNRTVISPARWALPSALGTSKVRNWREQFLRWRELWELPEFVYISQSDNRLLISLENDLHLSMLKREAEKHVNNSPLVLEEAIPSLTDNWVVDKKGKGYVCEVVLPFTKQEFLGSDAKTNTHLTAQRSHLKAVQEGSKSGVRVKVLGSEWLFLKLYAGKRKLDNLLTMLTDIMARFSSTLSGWFFIRYGDPLPHLRVRIKARPQHLIQDVLPQLATDLREAIEYGPLNRFTVDAYDRELERYGGVDGLDVSENLFFIDSDFAVRFVQRFEGSEALTIEDGAVISIDYLMRGLGFNFEERYALYRAVREGQSKASKFDEEKLARDYRSKRGELWALFKREYDLGNLLHQFQMDLAPPARTIRDLESKGRLSKPFESIVVSYIHMHCNRLGLNRYEEYRAVYLLTRLFDGFRHFIPDGSVL